MVEQNARNHLQGYSLEMHYADTQEREADSLEDAQADTLELRNVGLDHAAIVVMGQVQAQAMAAHQLKQGSANRVTSV